MVHDRSLDVVGARIVVFIGRREEGSLASHCTGSTHTHDGREYEQQAARRFVRRRLHILTNLGCVREQASQNLERYGEPLTAVPRNANWGSGVHCGEDGVTRGCILACTSAIKEVQSS